MLSRPLPLWAPDLSVPQHTGLGWAGAGAMAAGLMKGLGRAGQPGAALIWGLALTSKLAASLECPVIVGAVEGWGVVPGSHQAPESNCGRLGAVRIRWVA